MNVSRHYGFGLICAGAIGLACGSPARANIAGFGNFSGYTVNQSDGNAAPSVSPGAIQITGHAGAEDRSIFYNTPQDISKFAVTFTYQAQNATSAFAGGGGAAFVLQNNSAGPSAIGGGGVGSIGIAKSGAITLELYAASSASGFYANGASVGGSASTAPVSLISGDPINVTLTYDGSILQETLLDTTTLASYSSSILANIPSAANGSTAYVGFTAANTGNEIATQSLSNFNFTAGAVPEPSSAALLILASAALCWRRRALASITP